MTDSKLPSDAPDLPDWKKKLIEEGRKLLEAREETERLRRQSQDWRDTIPLPILDTSIGK